MVEKFKKFLLYCLGWVAPIVVGALAVFCLLVIVALVDERVHEIRKDISIKYDGCTYVGKVKNVKDLAYYDCNGKIEIKRGF